MSQKSIVVFQRKFAENNVATYHRINHIEAQRRRNMNKIKIYYSIICIFGIKVSNVIVWRKTKEKPFESISNIWSGKKFFSTWCNKGKKTWVNKKAVTKANFIYVMTFQKKSKEKNVRPSLAWFSSSNIHLRIFSGFWGCLWMGNIIYSFFAKDFNWPDGIPLRIRYKT